VLPGVAGRPAAVGGIPAPVAAGGFDPGGGGAGAMASKSASTTAGTCSRRRCEWGALGCRVGRGAPEVVGVDGRSGWLPGSAGPTSTWWAPATRSRGWCSPGWTGNRSTRCASRDGSSSTPAEPACRRSACTICGTATPAPPWPPGFRPRSLASGWGHATIAVTMDIYSHVLPGLDREAADTVARLILGGGVSEASVNKPLASVRRYEGNQDR
jgi:hypothetical protein